VATPQDVALSDVRKGISMLRKVSVPVSGTSCRLCTLQLSNSIDHRSRSEPSLLPLSDLQL